VGEGKGIASRWKKRYFLEYAIAVTIYLALTTVCMRRALETQHSSTRALLLLGPVFGILLMAVAVIRHFLSVDEYLRRTMTEYFAIAGVVAFICSLAYGFFEEVGFPRVSAWWVAPVMAIGMLLWRLVRVFYKR
jgi:pheromone shutdown protein TraB